MNRSLCMFFITLIYTVSCSAETITERTFLRTQPPGSGLLMRMDTSNIGIDAAPKDAQLRVHITPFYRWSHNKTDIGKLFGMNNDTTGAVDDFIEVNSDDASALGNSADFIHDYAGTATELKDKVLLRPNRKAYGARIDMCANLDESGDLQLRIGIPLIRISTSMNAEEATKNAQAGEIPGMGKTATLLDFLAGNVKNLSTENKQAVLDKMKITDQYTSKLGFSDAEWSLSSLLINTKRNVVRLGIIGTIPLNKKPEGVLWFEPLLTNGKHVAIGAELMGHTILFEKWPWKSALFFDAEYRYFFQGTEVRSPLYFNAAGAYSAWPSLTLGGKIDQKGVFPLVNVLTKEYDVTPRGLFEGAVGINLSRRTSSVSFGYSIYFRNKEKVEIPAWDDDTYAVANYSYDTTDAFTTYDAFSLASDGNNAALGNRMISTEDIVTDSISSPLQLVHRGFFSIDYHSANDSEAQFFIGIGGFMDFASKNNAALKEIAFWMRAGATF